jgi:hypothetical protein
MVHDNKSMLDSNGLTSQNNELNVLQVYTMQYRQEEETAVPQKGVLPRKST